MQLKHYAIYDSCSKEYVRTFTAKNDEEATRAAEYVVREKGFDDVAGKDRSIHYLFTLDTETGAVIDNQPRQLCNLASFIEVRKREVLENTLHQQLFDKEFVNKIKEQVLSLAIMEAKQDGKHSES